MAVPLDAHPDREVAIPLGSLCRSAQTRRPSDPRAALFDVFAERYGDEGDLFCEFCLAQYDLDEGPDVWEQVIRRNTVAVIAINDHAPLPTDTQADMQQTFVIEDGDISVVPKELRPIVQAALQRKQTGELTFHPVPPPMISLRRSDRLAWGMLGIGAAAVAYLAWQTGL